jgi:hypothetical protein
MTINNLASETHGMAIHETGHALRPLFFKYISCYVSICKSENGSCAAKMLCIFNELFVLTKGDE